MMPAMDITESIRSDDHWPSPGSATTDERSDIETFIAACYRTRFDASLRSFMPHLLAFRDRAGMLRAAAGLRFARDGDLFAERYLDQPVQQTIHALGHPQSARDAIVEVGNFAALDAGDARRTILALTPWLHGQGARWVVFVATRQLRNAFARIGLEPIAIGHAVHARVAGDGNDWGRYYDHAPEVLIGDLAAGVRFLASETPSMARAAPLLPIISACLA